VSTPASSSRRRSVAGRRLLAATVASLALHTLLFHGLTKLQLGDITPSPMGEQPASPRPQQPKRRADFSLRVPKQAATRQQAHEKPLDLPQPQPVAQPVRPKAAELPTRPQPSPRPLPDQPQRLVESAPRIPEPQQQQPANSQPLARRAATAGPADASLPTVADQLAAPDRAVAAAPAPLPAAALPARATSITTTVAGQWRPREAMLLERLATGNPSRPDRSGLSTPQPVVAPLPQRGRPTVTIDTAASNQKVPRLADTTAPTRHQSSDPAALQAATIRPRPGGIAARPPGRMTTGLTARVAAGLNAADQRGSGAIAGLPDRPAGLLATSPGNSTAAAASLPRQSEQLGMAAGPAAGSATVESLARGTSDPATAPPATGTIPAAPDLRPAAAAGDRLAMLATQGRARTSTRGLPAAATAGADEEGLSISSDQLRRSRLTAAAGAGPSSAGPSLERITAAALPADGRVRDVADAFAGRLADRRMAAAAAKVADREALAQADAMIDRGLAFLVRSQQADGRWSLASYAGATPAEAPRLTCDTAATGLALLSFLGAGHDHFSGPHRDTVRRGIEWLLAVQQPNGDLYLQGDPLSNSCGWMYSHAIATMALCEAVGMTGDPLVRPAATKACQFISASQHPVSGGWRYVPGTDSDLSVSGWMLVALRAGALAGVPVAAETFSGVRGLVDRSASAVDPTRYTYNPRDSQQRRSPLSASCMTAVGALMRLHTGVRPGDRLVARPAELLAAATPSYGSAEQRARDAYLWYYASQVLVHTGGGPWNRWYRDLVDLLATQQARTGPAAGSWDPLGSRPDRWGHYGGRIYVTTLHLLALEVPARHLPTYSVAAEAP